MGKKLKLAPEFLTETWRFVTEPESHMAEWMDLENDKFYGPWTAFVSGVGLSVGLLAIQATLAVYFFDSVVMFLVIVGSGATFWVSILRLGC